jgi:hypothetical protein
MTPVLLSASTNATDQPTSGGVAPAAQLCYGFVGNVNRVSNTLLEIVRQKPQSDEETQPEVDMLYITSRWARDYMTGDVTPSLRALKCSLLAMWARRISWWGPSRRACFEIATECRVRAHGLQDWPSDANLCRPGPPDRAIFQTRPKARYEWGETSSISGFRATKALAEQVPECFWPQV